MPTYLNAPASRDLTAQELKQANDMQGEGRVLSVVVEVKAVGTLYSKVQIVQPDGSRANFGITTEQLLDKSSAIEDAEVQAPDGEDG